MLQVDKTGHQPTPRCRTAHLRMGASPLSVLFVTLLRLLLETPTGAQNKGQTEMGVRACGVWTSSLVWVVSNTLRCGIAHLRMRAAPRGVAPRLASAAASSAAITSLSFTPCTNAHQIDIRLSCVNKTRLTRFARILARSVILGSSMHSPMNYSWVIALGWVIVVQSPQMQLRPKLRA